MTPRQPIDSEAVITDGKRDSVMMLYDWFKHMTTLSLVTLGGMIGILQAGPADVRPFVLSFILIAVAIAGIAGFDGMNRLLATELAGKPISPHLNWFRRAATMSYGIGVGAFLTLMVETFG